MRNRTAFLTTEFDADYWRSEIKERARPRAHTPIRLEAPIRTGVRDKSETNYIFCRQLRYWRTGQSDTHFAPPAGTILEQNLGDCAPRFPVYQGKYRELSFPTN